MIFVPASQFQVYLPPWGNACLAQCLNSVLIGESPSVGAFSVIVKNLCKGSFEALVNSGRRGGPVGTQGTKKL